MQELKIKNNINQISLEFFYILTIAFFILNILEFIWPSIVLAYININIVLILWLINVSVLLISHNDKTKISSTTQKTN